MSHLIFIKIPVLWSSDEKDTADELGIKLSEDAVTTRKGFYTFNLNHLKGFNVTTDGTVILRYIDDTYSITFLSERQIENIIEEALTQNLKILRVNNDGKFI